MATKSTTDLLALNTLAQLNKLYNLYADKPLKGFKDKPTAIARCAKLADELGMVAKQDGDAVILVAKPTPAKAAAASAGKRGPKPLLDDGLCIKVLKSNPRRDGTNRYRRFCLYKDGMTVADYLQAANKLQPNKPGRWRRDLIRDSKAGLIKLVKQSQVSSKDAGH